MSQEIQAQSGIKQKILQLKAPEKKTELESLKKRDIKE